MFRAIKIKKLHPHARMPRYATKHAAGMDLHVVFDPGEAGMVLMPARYAPAKGGLDKHSVLAGDIRILNTGLAIEIPRGYEGQLRSRSGLSSKYGVQVVNAPGTIDSDYRGEIRIPLVNLGKGPVMIEPGQRVAQLIIAPVARFRMVEADTLSETGRGDGGFGSTGTL